MALPNFIFFVQLSHIGPPYSSSGRIKEIYMRSKLLDLMSAGNMATSPCVKCTQWSVCLVCIKIPREMEFACQNCCEVI